MQFAHKRKRNKKKDLSTIIEEVFLNIISDNEMLANSTYLINKIGKNWVFCQV